MNCIIKILLMKKVLQKKGLYSIMDKIIKTGSKIAIRISEKFKPTALILHPNINSPSNFYVSSLVENFFHYGVNLQLKFGRDIV